MDSVYDSYTMYFTNLGKKFKFPEVFTLARKMLRETTWC